MITPKYVGPRRLIEVAVATLATDRALLLLGVPGTAKTWVGEHLAAAISGDSTLLVQGTAGTGEEALRYGWNYARLLADGPVPGRARGSPVMRAMQTGRDRPGRGADPHPLRRAGRAHHASCRRRRCRSRSWTRGAGPAGASTSSRPPTTATGGQRPVAALRRRFNTVVLPLPDDLEEEVDIVRPRVAELGRALSCRPTPTAPRRSAGS